VSPAGASYRRNALVTLTASAAPGWKFLQWLGDVTGTNAVTSVRVLNRDLCAQAQFGTTLGVTTAGNGTVSVDPAATLYPFGSEMRLTAMPQSGHYFGAWGGAVMSTNNPLFLTVTNGNPSVSCAFGPLSAGEVTLTVLVNGRGRVLTAPRGNRFPSNQSVTLTATADPDQEFLAWGGDASGTSTNLTVALAQSKVITANFTKRPRLDVFRCDGGPDTESVPIVLSGEFGGVYVIEASSDLHQWNAVANMTNNFGTVQFNDAMGGAQRFYRARSGP
jgi:hypothetical protein